MSMGISLWVLNIKCVYISYMNLYTFLIWFCIHSNEFVCTLNEFVDWTMLMPSECVFSICNSMAWPLPIQYTCIAHCIAWWAGIKQQQQSLKCMLIISSFQLLYWKSNKQLAAVQQSFQLRNITSASFFISKFFILMCLLLMFLKQKLV